MGINRHGWIKQEIFINNIFLLFEVEKLAYIQENDRIGMNVNGLCNER